MLQNAKKGQKVRTRKGDLLTIAEVSEHTHPSYSVLIAFTDGSVRSYMVNGGHHYRTCKHDIVAITTTPTKGKYT